VTGQFRELHLASPLQRAFRSANRRVSKNSPCTGGKFDSILIEAAFGLGETVVRSNVAPDRVEVSRSGLRVVRRGAGRNPTRNSEPAEQICFLRVELRVSQNPLRFQ